MLRQEPAQTLGDMLADEPGDEALGRVQVGRPGRQGGGFEWGGAGPPARNRSAVMVARAYRKVCTISTVSSTNQTNSTTRHSGCCMGHTNEKRNSKDHIVAMAAIGKPYRLSFQQARIARR